MTWPDADQRTAGVEELTDLRCAWPILNTSGTATSVPARRACRTDPTRGRAARALRGQRRGKDFARGSPVGDLDALALPEEEHGVIADHVATAQGLDADLVGGARPDVAVPFVTRALAEIAAGGLGHRLGQTQGRARRRVALGPVVRFTISTS